MELYEILVPAWDKNSEEIPLEHHKEWDSKVIALTGGLTVLHSISGKWINDGSPIHEKMIPIRIACDFRTIHQIIKMTAEHYDQIAVIGYKISDMVFIYSEDRKSKTLKHSQLPWKADRYDRSDKRIDVFDANDQMILQIYSDDIDFKEAEANLKLVLDSVNGKR